jgi:radical SAM protein with 4Fe4S-binding SPASM domain
MVKQEKVVGVFQNIFKDLKGKTKIGFDCCLTPILIDVIGANSVIGCSASRTSLAIMPDLGVLPCSFMEEHEKISLKNKSILDIWSGKEFNEFRRRIEKEMNKETCRSCNDLKNCLGGCPIFSLANCSKLKNHK